MINPTKPIKTSLGFVILSFGILQMPGSSTACDLCAVSGASLARGESASGFVATVSEQFIPFRTVQFQGEPLSTRTVLEGAYLDSSITHLVLGYHFTPRLGLSLNPPIVYRSFKRFELRPTGIATEEGSVSGFGDLALIGRWRVLSQSSMKSAFSIDILGGVKFPTGDSSRIENEVNMAAAYAALFRGGVHQHELGGVHEHDLAPGSGSYDAITGLTANYRWDRWFFNSLFQYYWRTEGESTFAFGDDLMISGGPGAYLVLNKKCTFSLQANAAYETRGRDEFLGSKSNNTGLTAWYLGPQLAATWGSHFSVNAGVDIPLRLANQGFQNVPDYRNHAGINWRF